MTARLDLTLSTLFNNPRFLQRDLRLRPAAAGCPVHGDGCLESVEGLGEAGRGALAIHEAVDKADGVVFRCTLSGSAADRLLEVPAWMFDRARCLDPSRLTASPFVSMRCAVSAVRSSSAGIEAAAVIIECAAFWRIQILSRPESGRGP